MRVENWNGYDIRFVEYKGEWWAVLKDICDALNLRTDGVSQRLDPNMMERVAIDTSDIPSKYNRSASDHVSTGVRSRGENKTRWMLVVNEIGVYEALFASRRLEARKFRIWTATVLQKLRSYVGLQGYEALRLTDKDIQDQIDDILDCLFWDDESKQLMISITVQGGDVDQVPFDEYVRNVKGE
jgi:prophage antirepressor-like protein